MGMTSRYDLHPVKEARDFRAQRVSFVSQLPVEHVLAALDRELGRDRGHHYDETPSRRHGEYYGREKGDDSDSDGSMTDHFEDIGNAVVGSSGFMTYSHALIGRLFSVRASGPPPPGSKLHTTRSTQPPRLIIHTYTLGNPPLVARLIEQDPVAALIVPPTLTVIGSVDGVNMPTRVIYNVPSSLLGVDLNSMGPELSAAAQTVDRKLEALVRRVTGN